MANELIATFNGGELSPFLAGRTDVDKYHSGCQTLENFIPLPYGGVMRSPGTEYLGAAKYDDRVCAVRPFVFSDTTRYVMEFGDEYIRFWLNGSLVLDDADEIVEVETPYQADELLFVQFIQINDIVYFAHPNHHPQKLTRTAANAFTFEVLAPDWPALLDENLDETFTLTPNGNTGSITVEASKPLFTPEHVGAVFQLSYPRASLFAEKTFAANGSSLAINAFGSWNLTTNGTWGGRLSIERSYDNGSTWNVIRFYSVNSDRNISDGGVENKECQLRLTFSDRNAGGASDKATLTINDPFDYGIIKITGVTDSDTASADVINDLRPYAGAVSGFTVTNAGTGYTSAPTVGITGGGGTGATGTAVLNGVVSSVAVDSGGSGYLSVPAVVFTGGGGSGAAATAVLTGDVVTSIVVTNGGTGYTSAPSVSFTGGGGGSGAAATASINRFVASISVGLGGSGYTSSPAVTLTGGGGTGATATATTTNAGRTTYYWSEGAWSGARGYPHAISVHESRVMYGGTSSRPQSIWGSRIDDFQNFRLGPLADDAIFFTIASRTTNFIHWMTSKDGSLFIGKLDSEGRFSSGSADTAISASDVSWVDTTKFGSAYIPPVELNDSLMFLQGQRRKIRELSFSNDRQGYVATDLTLMSEHISRSTFIDWASQQQPDAIVWAIRGDGELAGMTYERDQGIMAWHRRTTAGSFESVCTIPGEFGDEVWVCVKREIDGEDKRFIERFNLDWREQFEDENKPEWWYLDCAVRVENDPASATIAGLDHLEGETVNVLADGGDAGSHVVTDGEITIGYECEVAIVGLPYTSTLRPMKLDQILQSGTSQGRKAKVSNLKLRLLKSLGGQYSTDGTNYNDIPSRSTDDNMDDSPPPFTGDTERLVDDGNWRDSAEIWIQQTKPMPLTILAMIINWSPSQS